jgi:hypothetical protein
MDGLANPTVSRKMPVDRKQISDFLVLHENVSEQEVEDFFFVVDQAEKDDPGSSDEMLQMVRDEMSVTKMKTILTQIADIDPSKATRNQIELLQKIAARAAEQ